MHRKKSVFDESPTVKDNPFNFDAKHPMDIEYDEYRGCHRLGLKKKHFKE